MLQSLDVRGRVPDELNDEVAYQTGRAFAQISQPAEVVGRDVRLDSPALAAAVGRGLNDGGTAVVDIGLCGTE